VRPHQRIAVEEASQVGEVRRAAEVLAREQGFNDVAAGRLAIAVTELGTNLVRHAREGVMLVGAGSAGDIELIAWDRGPGMDVARCVQDGYSTAGTAGQGLGAVRRAADRFSAYSLAGRGSVIAACVRMPTPAVAAPAFEIAALGLPAPGERVSGDGWGLRERASNTMLMVADGLGHGPDAAAAADAALAAFQALAAESPAAVLEAAHDRMRATRGAAVAIAAFSASHARLSFAGAGNICARLISGVQDRSLLSQHGTLGVQIRRLQDMAYEWPEHAVLVMHSDGIVTRWTLNDAPGLLQCDAAVIAGWILRDHSRGRDDATVVVVKRRH
jgi:anti-sigma regulatory factor (Ser/Thr protein kinase)